MSRIFPVVVAISWVTGLASAQRVEPPPQRCGEEPSETLLVFVGRRIDVQQVGTEVPPRQPFIMDGKFLARYEVLRVLCGAHHSNRIEFEVYDHYGKPAFSHFETALLYVARHQGRLVHEKYLYNPVYETADGDWAACGDPYVLDDVHRGDVRAEPIRFKDEVSFPIDTLSDLQVGEQYPPAFFNYSGGRAICTAGARIRELFVIKRDGFLRARGIFKR